MGLPTRDNPKKATRIGPKILIIYSLPKVGKTEALTELAKRIDTLIIDAEEPHGTATYETTAIEVTNMAQVKYVPTMIEQEGEKLKAAGKKGMDAFPYKILALDTLDAIEDMTYKSALARYIDTPLAKDSSRASGLTTLAESLTVITELPMGGGYYYLREELKDVVNMYARAAPYLIIVLHVKEKYVAGKDGKVNEDVKLNDISLSGKSASIIAAKADAIGYMYRKDNQLRISFQTYDGAVMGARQKYLAGKDMEFSWEAIYPELFGEKEEEIK